MPARAVNAASARYVRLSIGGRPFTLLGTDGGLLSAPVAMNEALLTPGDRGLTTPTPTVRWSGAWCRRSAPQEQAG